MKYIGKKIVTLITTLLIISFLTFLAFQRISGDPVTSMLGTQTTLEREEALREELGLNDSVIIQYGRWLKGFVTGDMGISYSYQQPVKDIIMDKIPITAALSLLSFLIILAVSIPGGLLAARYESRWIDKITDAVNHIVMAVPAFFLGMILTVLFGSVLKWFQPGNYVSYSTHLGQFLSYLIFPAIAIALPKCAMTGKLLRSSVIEEMNKDYVRTVRSKGTTTGYVLYHHVLKNAFMPVITFLGLTMADIVAGSLVIEQVFSIPGLGRLLITSISGRDYPMVQAIIVIIAIMVMVVNLIVDITYRLLNPKLKL
jgi:peptide/nickel transport system permease protein